MQVAAADALRGMKMFEKLDVPGGIVENMSGEIFLAFSAGEQLAAAYDGISRFGADGY